MTRETYSLLIDAGSGLLIPKGMSQCHDPLPPNGLWSDKSKDLVVRKPAVLYGGEFDDEDGGSNGFEQS